MMNDHDFSLIAQLADGTIEPADEPAARALLEDNAQAQAEYDAQIAALAALRGVAPARMTMAESASLRRTLQDQLGLEPDKQPEPVRKRRSVPWGGLAVAAAALVGVVVLAPLLGLLSAGSSDTADTTIALERTADAAAEFSADSGTVLESEIPLGAPATTANQSALVEETPAPAAATTSAVPRTTPASDDADKLSYLGEIGSDGLSQLEAAAAALSGDITAWRSSLTAGTDAEAITDEVLADFAGRQGCADAIPDGFTGDPVAIAAVAGDVIVLYRIQDVTGEDQPILFAVALDTCSQVAGAAGG